MTKTDLQEWINSPVTKTFRDYVTEAIQEVQETSCIHDTVDQTALQASRNEGFCEGVDALANFIEDTRLSMEDSNE